LADAGREHGRAINLISTPGQFRNATREIAQNMGIDFRF